MSIVSPRVSPSPRRSGSGSEPRTIANRIFTSFIITLAAFAVTATLSLLSQRRTAEDAEYLATGYLPVALNLGQLCSVQSTIAALVDGIPEEKDLLALRTLLDTLSGVRQTMASRTRNALEQLREQGRAATRQRALELTGELDAARAAFDDDRGRLDRLLVLVRDDDGAALHRHFLDLAAAEHDGLKHMQDLSAHVDAAMTALSQTARARERRAFVQLIGITVLTLAIGLHVAFSTKRLLQPLRRVTSRARAVAHGDLTAHAAYESDDELGQLSTAFEQMVSAVAQAQRRAVANERLAAIGKMAAHVTHEIRNPLSSIGLNLDLLEEELQHPTISREARQLLSSITREVSRLESLSEEYLRVARLPQPRMEANDIASTVEDVLRFESAELQRTRIHSSLRIDHPVAPTVFDEGQIRQALLNLLRNAREAMPDGGTLEVSVRDEGMGVVVQIDDTGPGIASEVQARIFDPFFSTKGEGTGLGLAITKQIVEAHGGTISCDSRSEGGASFRLLLPLALQRTTFDTMTLPNDKT